MKLRRKLYSVGINQVHSYNLGTSILQQNFENREFIADKAFIFSDKRILEHEGDISIVDSGMYACIYLDDYDKEIEYGNQLLDFCNKMGYALAGDYICEELTEFNVFDDSKRNMFLRLQVPIKF